MMRSSLSSQEQGRVPASSVGMMAISCTFTSPVDWALWCWLLCFLRVIRWTPPVTSVLFVSAHPLIRSLLSTLCHLVAASASLVMFFYKPSSDRISDSKSGQGAPKRLPRKSLTAYISWDVLCPPSHLLAFMDKNLVLPELPFVGLLHPLLQDWFEDAFCDFYI